MAVRNMVWIEVCDSVRRVNWITPNPPPVDVRERPKSSQGRCVCEVWPKIAVAHDPGKRRARDMLSDRFLPQEIKACLVLLTDVYFSDPTGAREHDRLVRGRKSACQQKANIKSSQPVVAASGFQRPKRPASTKPAC
jgi:hypothetical protein